MQKTEIMAKRRKQTLFLTRISPILDADGTDAFCPPLSAFTYAQDDSIRRGNRRRI